MGNILDPGTEHPSGTVLIQYCKSPAKFKLGNKINRYICQSDGTWTQTERSCECKYCITSTNVEVLGGGGSVGFSNMGVLNNVVLAKKGTSPGSQTEHLTKFHQQNLQLRLMALKS